MTSTPEQPTGGKMSGYDAWKAREPDYYDTSAAEQADDECFSDYLASHLDPPNYDADEFFEAQDE